MCVADASDYARQGSSYADFRLHYMMELFSLNLTEVYFTTAAEGETLTRYTHIREKDLILADRAYATRVSASRNSVLVKPGLQVRE